MLSEQPHLQLIVGGIFSSVKAVLRNQVHENETDGRAENNMAAAVTVVTAEA